MIQREYGEVIDVVDPKYGYEMAPGNPLVKEYFSTFVIPGLMSGDKRTGSGALMVGTPGTGKSLFARCMANKAGGGYIESNHGRTQG